MVAGWMMRYRLPRQRLQSHFAMKDKGRMGQGEGDMEGTSPNDMRNMRADYKQ